MPIEQATEPTGSANLTGTGSRTALGDAPQYYSLLALARYQHRLLLEVCGLTDPRSRTTNRAEDWKQIRLLAKTGLDEAARTGLLS